MFTIGEVTLPIDADVSTADGVERAVAACMDHFGLPPQALAHCAGSTLLTSLHRSRERQYRECPRASLDGACFTFGAFLKANLAHKQRGAAVLISPVVARIGVIHHEAIAWLRSAQTQWITRQILALDGGVSAIRPMVRG